MAQILRFVAVFQFLFSLPVFAQNFENRNLGNARGSEIFGIYDLLRHTRVWQVPDPRVHQHLSAQLNSFVQWSLGWVESHQASLPLIQSHIERRSGIAQDKTSATESALDTLYPKRNGAGEADFVAEFREKLVHKARLFPFLNLMELSDLISFEFVDAAEAAAATKSSESTICTPMFALNAIISGASDI